MATTTTKTSKPRSTSTRKTTTRRTTTSKAKTAASKSPTSKSTASKSTTRKTAAKPKTAATAKKTAAASTPPKTVSAATTPTVVTPAQPVVAGPALRKKELIERVVARSGIKKKDARPVVEAMLAELGAALASGQELILPPMGRVKINREKDTAAAKVIIAKVRQSKAAPGPAKDPLADGAE